MSQIRKPSQLPPLAELWPDGRKLPGRGSQTYELLQALRAIADRLRQAEPRPFYSTRAVALFFQVPQTTVVRVYRELERDGVLLRVRASHTMLQPATRQPRHSVRGVVGVPIWQFGYCTWSEWRVFFDALEERLRRRNWVADFVFYHHGEPNTSAFTERLLEHNLDCVVWYQPLRAYLPLLQTLADSGVEVAIVNQPGESYPFPQYHLSWQQATRRTLQAWQRDGIQRVTVVATAAALPSWLKEELAESGLQHQFVNTTLFTSAPPAATTNRTGYLFADWYTMPVICSAWRQQFPSFLRRERALFTLRLDVAASEVPGCRADFALIDWAKLAEQIATDIAAGTLRRQTRPVVHEAQPHHAVDAATYAQVF